MESMDCILNFHVQVQCKLEYLHLFICPGTIYLDALRWDVHFPGRTGLLLEETTWSYEIVAPHESFRAIDFDPTQHPSLDIIEK